MKIAVVGGGASGLVAAIEAKTKENEVVVLEQNNQTGKKLLLTGNGKCNYWNEEMEISHFHSLESENLEEFLTQDDFHQAYSFLETLGIIPYIKNGYYYPHCKNAFTIRNLLEEECNRRKVVFQKNFCVQKIIKQQDTFIINPDKEALVFDRVILACGGSSYSKTGSNGNGYFLAQLLGHHITKILPSLVSLKTKENMKDLKGVRADVEVSIYEENSLKKKEKGEILFTDYGVSGIVIFNVSRYASIGLSEKKKISFTINFLPFLKEDAFSFIENHEKRCFPKSISLFLDSIVPYQIGNRILKQLQISPYKKWSELSFQEQQALIQLLTTYPLTITETKSLEEAQVTLGGVSLKEIDWKTCESKQVKGLYFTGELLDVDGDCGGYNLALAWITGMKAGRNCQKENS